MSLHTKLKIDNYEIPCIPFLWYREQELMCPINFIKLESNNNINGIKCNNMYLLIQRHICENGNLYICLHSLMYYKLKKSENKYLTISDEFNKNIKFAVKIIPLNKSEIIQINGGLKINEFVIGSVYIHNKCFSPPGCLHFKVNNNLEKNEFLCHIICNELNINICCLFILYNDLKDINIDKIIDDIITNFK